MFSKMLFGGFFALVLSACSGHAAHDSVAQADTTASAASPESSGGFIEARLRRGVPHRIERFDTNHDGVLQASEVPPRLRAWFVAVDANHDNIVTAEEIRAFNRAHPHEHHGRNAQDGQNAQDGRGHRFAPRDQTGDVNL